jgi:hypothetical protein
VTRFMGRQSHIQAGTVFQADEEIGGDVEKY